MASTPTTIDKTPLPNFEKYGKVSVWCSTISYETIPDSYFVEDEEGVDPWAKNFLINEYDHENMETNGVASGMAVTDVTVIASPARLAPAGSTPCGVHPRPHPLIPH